MGDKLLSKPSIHETSFESLKTKLKANCAPKTKKNESNRRPGPMRRSLFANLPRLRPYFVRVRRSSVHEEIAKHQNKSDILPQIEYSLEKTGDFPARFARSQSSIRRSTPDLMSICDATRSLFRRPISPTLNQGRTHSPKRTRTRSKSPIIYRSLNSCLRRWGSGDELHVESVKIKIEKTKKARLYLLRQPGPHAFTVAGENNDKLFKVDIGPQTCSCNEGNNHCIHLLFVMMRVFEVPENDSKMFDKPLKDFEVDDLFHKYKERTKRLVTRRHESRQPDSTTNVSLMDSVDPMEEEDVKCPICQFPMFDGEETVTCLSRCKNKLHHHCMEILIEKAEGSVVCPLCRSVWSEDDICQVTRLHHQIPIVTTTTKCNTDVTPSSTCINLTSNFSNSRDLTRSSKKYDVTSSSTFKCSWLCDDVSSAWAEVFVSRTVEKLHSSDWVLRMKSLECVIKDAKTRMKRLVNDETSFGVTTSTDWVKLVTCFADVLRVMAGDPVVNVYTTCICGTTSLLASYLCVTDIDSENLQKLMAPIVKKILKKCAEDKSKMGVMSIEAIVKLSRGQAGEMCVGCALVFPAQFDVCGLVFVLKCIMDWENDWRSILGRMNALDELMEKLPSEFELVQVETHKENLSSSSLKRSSSKCFSSSNSYTLYNHERIISILNFALKFLKHPHTNVHKMAERICVRTTRLTSHNSRVYSQACDLISSVDPELVERLEERMSDTKSDQKVMYTSVRLRDRRHSLGKSFSYRGNASLWSPRLASTPIKPSRTSLPNYFVNTRRGSSLSPIVAQSRMDWMTNRIDQQQQQRPKRPNFLPLKPQVEGDISKCQAPRRCSWGGTGEKCCFNLICHVHSSPCEQRCQPKKMRYPPVPPNTPQVPVGDLIDFSGEDRMGGGGGLRDVNDMRRMSLPLMTALGAIPEAYSANNLAFRDQRMAITSPAHSNQSAFGPRINSIGDLNFGDPNSTFNMESSSYRENVHWMRIGYLGNGAFSKCYLGRDVQTGVNMAVKQIKFGSPDPREQEKRRLEIHAEIKMMMSLEHPNIVQILGVSRQETHYDLFVEWMPGGSVADSLQKFGPFNDYMMVKYISQVLAGLGYLHNNRVLHRDLKGANLLIDSTGQILRIGDFGTATRLSAQQTLPYEFTRECGTTAFMAPEMLQGSPYGRSCDVWSVGCIMIEMATTLPPWSGYNFSNNNALMFRICTSNGPRIPDNMSPEIRHFTSWCLQRDRALRPTVKELQSHPIFQII